MARRCITWWAWARTTPGRSTFVVRPESLACGLATHLGEAVVTADVRQDPTWEPWTWLADQFGYRACWSFPLHSTTGSFVGSFAVYSPKPRLPTQQEVDFISHVTQVAAIIIARRRGWDRGRAGWRGGRS